MSAAIVAAWIALLLLTGVILLQLLLTAGFPVGAAAWGGRYRVLPAGLRIGSLLAAVVLTVAMGVVLARAGIVPVEGEAPGIRISVWAFAAFFGLNALGNLASRSPIERYVMAPVSVLLAVCFVIVAMSPS